MIGLRQLDAVGAADHEREVAAGVATALDEASKLEAVELLALGRKQRHVGVARQAAGEPFRVPVAPGAVAQLDLGQADVATEQLCVMLDVVDVGGSQPPDRDHDDLHCCDTNRRCARQPPVRSTELASEPPGQDRHINIQVSPEMMAGVYSNFANVSHSDYEFTITFARVDHEIEDEEIPGVVVSRINLSPKFMRELVDAMEDNYAKWRHREDVKNLPEFGARSDLEDS